MIAGTDSLPEMSISITEIPEDLLGLHWLRPRKGVRFAHAAKGIC